ncbi:MAG: 4Fe-4S dicluster domain-containing protein [Thermodesulfobacteriota bacterium]|jgi:formate dehydrogenase iron-sulfur subunit
MGKYAALVDVSKCTACRGCQIACKQWNELPGEKTVNVGTYQNPPDLSVTTFTLVRFKEISDKGEVRWNFFKDQCRHCLEPPCKEAADTAVKGAITQDENGCVLFTEKTRLLNIKEIREACPYDIPRQDPNTKIMDKCTFCADRIANNMIPACIKTCPTGALTFGLRDKILEMANKRLAEVKERFPLTRLVDKEEVSWIYLLHRPEAEFQMTVRAKTTRPVTVARRTFLKPLGTLVAGTALLGSVTSGSDSSRE